MARRHRKDHGISHKQAINPDLSLNGAWITDRHTDVADYQTCESKCLAASSSECVAYQFFSSNKTCMFMTLCTGEGQALRGFVAESATGGVHIALEIDIHGPKRCRTLLHGA